jgi:protein subunit release factor A
MTEIDPRDVRVDTFTGGPLSDCAVRVTHVPTNTVATAKHASKLTAQRMAMEELGRLLNAKAEE